MGEFDEAHLSIFGMGIYLPKAKEEIDFTTAAKGTWVGWKHRLVAKNDEHPSTIAAAALQDALKEAGINASELKAVVATSLTRDIPMMSVSNEVMKLVGISGGCLGFDLVLNCASTIVALDLMLGWLRANGGGYAAIINGERGAEAIDLSDPGLQSLWCTSDGGSALIVGMVKDKAGFARYCGGSFHTIPKLHDYFFLKYGGTLHPKLPEGMDPRKIHVNENIDPIDVLEAYTEGLDHTIGELQRRFGPQKYDWLVGNQNSKAILQYASEVADIPHSRICIIGDETGHVGCSDIPVSLQFMRSRGQLKGNILLVSSSFSVRAAGILRAD